MHVQARILRWSASRPLLKEVQGLGFKKVPVGSIVVPFGGSYLESYKVIPKRNYYGAYG